MLSNTEVIVTAMAANVVACLQSRAGLEDSSVNPALGALACISSLEQRSLRCSERHSPLWVSGCSQVMFPGPPDFLSGRVGSLGSVW